MKKIFLRTLSALLCVAMLATLMLAAIPASAAGTNGLTFTPYTTYVTDKNVAKVNVHAFKIPHKR